MEDDRRRQVAIDIIDALYPIDAQHPATAAIGQELLRQAKEECQSWRDEPLDVLEAYARLCREYEERQDREFRHAQRTRNGGW